jgi:hypothetical protein
MFSCSWLREMIVDWWLFDDLMTIVFESTCRLVALAQEDGGLILTSIEIYNGRSTFRIWYFLAGERLLTLVRV